MELEKKVLKGIMEFLDGQEGESLKKHPKLMAMKVEKVEPALEVEKPEVESEEDLSPEMVQKILEMYNKSK